MTWYDTRRIPAPRGFERFFEELEKDPLVRGCLALGTPLDCEDPSGKTSPRVKYTRVWYAIAGRMWFDDLWFLKKTVIFHSKLVNYHRVIILFHFWLCRMSSRCAGFGAAKRICRRVETSFGSHVQRIIYCTPWPWKCVRSIYQYLRLPQSRTLSTHKWGRTARTWSRDSHRWWYTPWLFCHGGPPKLPSHSGMGQYL